MEDPVLQIGIGYLKHYSRQTDNLAQMLNGIVRKNDIIRNILHLTVGNF